MAETKIIQSMRTFYHLLGNTLLANLTNMTVWFAIIFYAYLQTRSIMATAIMSGIYTLSVATTGIWFGSLVDHHKKKTVMLWSSTISLTIYVICLLIYWLSPAGTFTTIHNVTFWVFVVLLLMAVIVGNIRYIALTTAIKFLVEEENRDKANGMVGTATGIAFLAVSVISAFLVGYSGMFLVLVLAIFLTCAVIIHLWLQPIYEHGITHLDSEQKPGNVDLKGTITAIRVVPGLLALIFFTTFNNFLGGVFMSLMDGYGLSLVSVQVWGLIWGFLSTAFILGGLFIAKFGLGKNPVKTLLLTNVVIWSICTVFTVHSSIIPMVIGMYVYLCVVPFIEASEQTILQKVVPQERLGRVIGFAQSVEQSASPVTSFLIGPLAEYIVIPFMTTGAGVQLIGGWFGTGEPRGIALIFTIAGIIGFIMTIIAFNSKFYGMLSERYMRD